MLLSVSNDLGGAPSIPFGHGETAIPNRGSCGAARERLLLLLVFQMVCEIIDFDYVRLVAMIAKKSCWHCCNWKVDGPKRAGPRL
jgi:hypothetical protein